MVAVVETKFSKAVIKRTFGARKPIASISTSTLINKFGPYMKIHGDEEAGINNSLLYFNISFCTSMF